MCFMSADDMIGTLFVYLVGNIFTKLVFCDILYNGIILRNLYQVFFAGGLQ